MKNLISRLMSRASRHSALATLAVGALASTGAHAQRVTQIDTTFAFSKTGAVNLSILSGEIRVTAWARDDIRIVATGDRSALSSSFSSTRVRLEQRRTGASRPRFDITVPIGVRVNADATTGTVNVNGTRADVAVTTLNGQITVSEASGRIEIETAAAPIVLQRLEGSTNVSALGGGRISVSEIKGDLHIEALANVVLVDHAELENLHFEAAAGGHFDFSGTLAPRGRHTIETLTGRTTLRFPAEFGVTLELQSMSGSLRSPDFPILLRPSGGTDRGRNSERQQYSINGGGSLLTIETLSGDVLVTKIGAQTRR